MVSSKDARVIALRKRYPYWGKMKLQRVYEREHKEPITSWYIQRVIETYKLYAKKRKPNAQKDRKRQVKKRISECEKVPQIGFLIHLDTIVLHLFGTKRYVCYRRHSKIAMPDV